MGHKLTDVTVDFQLHSYQTKEEQLRRKLEKAERTLEISNNSAAAAGKRHKERSRTIQLRRKTGKSTCSCGNG